MGVHSTGDADAAPSEFPLTARRAGAYTSAVSIGCGGGPMLEVHHASAAEQAAWLPGELSLLVVGPEEPSWTLLKS